ncbi:hypothetical protein V496_00518 [Pseudogymnoascus sp. VKM F-4515 (FW-2607)]|nr:hypothetical protein V496_00518 [Pseudogymnoascus sp. VKM F-4515 (FW-2607)]KFY92445.1 hypothetical protein V498_04936 [Pseudogymnoascus sp. VKM F-4517 (FW-2822)]
MSCAPSLVAEYVQPTASKSTAQVYGAATSRFVTSFVCSFGLCSHFVSFDPHGLVIFPTLGNVLLTDADIKASNILSEIEDESILAEFEAAEANSPSANAIRDDRTIYASRKLGLPKTFGPPVLCDFGVARFEDEVNNEDIQPEVYRAPEVILEMDWSYPVDIWNVGVMIWDLFQDKHIFNGRDPTGKYSNRYHLAEMVAYMGPPPIDFLHHSEESWSYFDKQGNLLDPPDMPASLSLESSEENLEGRRKELFLQFMRKMLQWVPEDRQSAAELLHDPWLNDEMD